MTDRLTARGYRVFRMDMGLRGRGGSRSCRPTAAAQATSSRRWGYIAEEHPESPTLAIGFSLGGCLTLNLLAEAEAKSRRQSRFAFARHLPAD